MRQTPTFVDLRSVMDDGRILIVKLSNGRIGDDACNLLNASTCIENLGQRLSP